MSFINTDEKLFVDLMQGLFKSAQDAATANELNVAKKLINKLERQYSNVPEPANISSTNPVGLNVPDLQSLSKFLQFLSNNQIKLSGSRVAYTEKEYQGLSEEEKSKLSPISANINRDTERRTWNESDIFVNLPLLNQYVHYLQEKASGMEKSGDVQGQILRVMVGKLIDSINTIDPNSGLSRNKQKSTPDNPNVLADDAVLDDFNTKSFDIKNPFADKGSNQIKLYAKDLKSKESLNAWLLGDDGSEASIITYDSSGQRSVVPFSDEKANPCVIINVLYLRANRWKSLSKSTEDTKKFNYYVTKIQELGPTYSDPSGTACSISGIPAHSQMTALVPGKDGPNSGSGNNAPAALTPQVIAKIMGDLPFAIRDISFDRIRSFFSSVQAAVGNASYASQITNHINEANQAMNAFTSMTHGGDTVIPLGMNPLQFANLLSNQKEPGKQFFPAVSLLIKILDNTRQVVEAFVSAYGNIIKEHYPNYIPYILGQIGRNPDDPSIYSRNSSVLEGLRTAGKVT